MLDVIAFLFLLSILVCVHELGHFAVARLHGVSVPEFGFGLPPRIAAKKVGGTEFSLNALPIGGFVRLKGEEENDTSSDSFSTKPTFAKIQVIAAGVICNVIFAFAVFAVGYTVFSVPESNPSGAPLITFVEKDSPAYQAGIRMGDKPLAIVSSGQETAVKTPDEFVKMVKSYAGTPIEVVLERENTAVRVALTPRANPPAGQGPLGAQVIGLSMVRYPFPESVARAGEKIVATTRFFGESLARLFGGLVTLRPEVKEVSGPIGLFDVFAKTKSLGIGYILNLLGTISLSLALVNILPLPALDGGRIAFLLLNKAPLFRVKPETEALIHQVGIVVLLILAALIAVKDIATIL